MFHVLNRSIARMRVFEKTGDYEAFEQTLCETLQQTPMRICAYCVLPNHWHFLWPEHDGDLARFMQRLTITHVRRWPVHRHYVGLGHVYQGRYKSFPVEEDEHFLAVARYVERNALRANLVERAEQWRWGSLWRRSRVGAAERPILTTCPVELPNDWVERVNRADNGKELEALRRSVCRGRPFGTPEWQRRIAKHLGLESAYRSAGRPGSQLQALRGVTMFDARFQSCQYRTCPVFGSYRTCPVFGSAAKRPPQYRPPSPPAPLPHAGEGSRGQKRPAAGYRPHRKTAKRP